MDVPVAKFTVHEQYDVSTNLHDIGLVKLQSNVQYSGEKSWELFPNEHQNDTITIIIFIFNSSIDSTCLLTPLEFLSIENV